MKKPFFILLALLTVSLLIGWYFYTHYISKTLKTFHKELTEKLDTIQQQVQIPQPVLEGDCFFNRASQTDDFLKNIPEFSDYTWNNTSKKATVFLENGDKLTIERGGCDRFNFYAHLYLQNTDLTLKNKNAIFKKALWIVEKLFDQPEYQFFTHSLAAGEYEILSYPDRFLITLEHPDFCHAELLFLQNTKTQKAEIRIGYSQCKK